MNIHETLKNQFGFEQFLPGQEEVISRILDNRSTLAVFPTGQGKSLCYQLSSLHLPGLTLVVSPLMALMKDQVDFLKARKILAARIDSSLSREEFAAVQKDLQEKSLKLLYVAPERFNNEGFLGQAKRLNISLLVIDEAHCISEWGHNFRPDYLKLADLVQDLQIPVTLTLTATATPKVAEDIQAAFDIQSEDYIHTGFYRPNLTLRFSPTPDPLPALIERLSNRKKAPVIVYVTLQATAEHVAEALCQQNFIAKAYHAGMKDEDRQAVQEWFMQSSETIVVATIAFGMGIDKANIRYIYHYNLPKSLENYAQEIGRSGRDGEQAICEILGSGRDLTVLENFVYGDTPEVDGISKLVKSILSMEELFSLSIYETANAYDMRPLVVNTLLTYLELEKIIESTGPFFTSYKFIPNRTSEEIFSQFNAERSTFLRGIFSCAKKGNKWFQLDVDEVIEKNSTTRERIVTALNYLQEQGYLELQVAGARRGFRIINRPSEGDTEKMTKRLQERFLTREKNDIKRIGLVVSLIRHPGCKINFLLSYFGEDRTENCGHCEFCLTESAAEVAWAAILPEQRNSTDIKRYQSQVKAVLDEQHEALISPRQQARFFSGIRSPKSTRAKLHKHQSFGVLANVHFSDVLKWLES